MYCLLSGLVIAWGYAWISAGSGAADVYLRSVVFGGGAFLGVCALPVVAKWVLVGRWKPGEFPVWGPAYLRFWTVKALLNANPMRLFTGNPLYVLYLRALGARIGKGVTILSPTVPVCTDLLTIGAGTLIRKDSSFVCYEAYAGRIRTGPVTLGKNVFVGEKTVLDIGTSMGDGRNWATPPRCIAVSPYRRDSAGTAPRPSAQRWTTYGSGQPTAAQCAGRVTRWPPLLQLLFVYVPLAVGGGFSGRPRPVAGGAGRPGVLKHRLRAVLRRGAGSIRRVPSSASSWSVWCRALVPRVLNLVIQPDKIYPLYGVHYSAQRAIARMTNIKFFKWLCGDSSYIVHYLRGHRLRPLARRADRVELRHGGRARDPVPGLLRQGHDGRRRLSLLNADFSSTSFRVIAGVDRAAQLPREQHRLSREAAGPATTACSRRR